MKVPKLIIIKKKYELKLSSGLDADTVWAVDPKNILRALKIFLKCILSF